jgi:uncharacterized protein YbjT (DUF2867 family)
MNILVIGATGTIGSKLVPRLVALGHQVTCLARDPQRLERYNWSNVRILKADALDLESLQKVMPGHDVAYYLIHSMSYGKTGYIKLDEQAAQNFGNAASQAGIQRIIYLGGLGECEMTLSPHLESRQVVGDILRTSGVSITELRAGIIIGCGSMSFEMIRYLTERLPVMTTPRWVSTRCQPIAIQNVLDYLICSLTEPKSTGRIYEIGGPDVMTYGKVMQVYAEARHLTRYLIPIPVLTPHLSSIWVNFITPLPASYVRPLIEGLRDEVIVHDPSAMEDFNIILLPYKEAVQLALKRDGSGEVEALWAGGQKGLAPGVTHRDVQGMFIEQRRTVSTARPEQVYTAFERIGGKHGWYYANWLWRLRGWLDKLAGGPGMKLKCRDPEKLIENDILDGWRVEKIQPGRLIRLYFEMKAPGPAWLQFEVQPRADGGTLLILTAFFEPHGVMGLLYWFSLYPFHLLIFRGMSQAMIRFAEAMG